MYKKINKTRYIPILIFILGVIFVFVNTYLNSRHVHFNEYDFVVTKVAKTPTGSAIPFNKDIEMEMWQYQFYPEKIIKIGDSIHKGTEEKCLYIFRRDETEKFILADSIQPTGMYSWKYKS